MRRALLALFVALPLAVTMAVGGPADVVRALPSGFTDEFITSVSSPTAVEALPDGRAIVLEKGGRVKRIDARSGAVEVRTMARFNVCTNSERGLLGFTPDPDYAFNGFVYVYYTIPSGQPGGCHNRVSRFSMDEATLYEESEFVLVDNISSVAGNHNAGDIEIGNDGYLYIATGDAGRDPRGNSGSAGSNDAAQDLSLLNGKILRVDRLTGVAAPGNPFSGPGTADCRLRGNTPSTPGSTCREIHSYGLRNPFRFAFDPNTSATRFFINDVGQNTREEVNNGVSGANYGWPSREGQCPQGQNPPCAGPPSGVTDPITDYNHDRGLYITAGAFVPDGVWPAQYDGGYLFADGAFGTIWLRKADGSVDYNAPFHDVSRPTDMTFVTEPDGPALWYVQQNGQVRRVRYALPSAPADSGPLRYEPLGTMDRRFDSREQTPRADLRAGHTRLIDLDAPAGAVAALANVTLVRPVVDGAFSTAWQPRTLRPATSNVNAPRSAVVGNSTIVPLDTDGNMLLFNQVTTGVVVDVAGFFFPQAGPTDDGRFEALDPSRLIDTRDGAADPGDFTRVPDGAGERVTIGLLGEGGLPADADEIAAVAITIAGINNEGSLGGFATAYPTGGSRPLASNVNVNADPDVRANLAVVSVGAAGSIEIYLEGVDNITVDVAGYFTGDGAPTATAGRFHLIPPTREADTRVPLGPAGLGNAASTVALDPTSAPASASGIAQNLTLARSGGRGFVTAFPAEPRPVVSSINASAANQIRGVLGLVALSGGRELVYSEVQNGIVIDSLGWFE